ncbi:hypothetical protein QYM36_002189, partial [Artemia franciscana]
MDNNIEDINKWGQASEFCCAEDFVKPPRFIKSLRDIAVRKGDTVELEVTIEGSEPLRCLWIKEEVEISSDTSGFQVVCPEKGRYILRILSIEDTAVYICEAYNHAGDTDCWCQVIVTDDELLLPPSKGPSITPYFNGIPPSFQFKEGCKAEISVSFQGSPTPVAEWQFNSDEGANRYKVLSDNYHSVLQIDPVTLAEEGMIECTVWNTGGSSTALIEVIVVPSERDKIGSGYTGGKRKSFEKIPAIIKGPEDIFAIRGSEVLLEALFVGKPEPSVVWLKGNEVLETSGRISSSVKDGFATLHLRDVSDDDCGKYIIVVANSHGSDCHFASVNIQGPPDPPREAPNVSEIVDGGVTLSWYGSAYDGGKAITGYIVEYAEESELDWKILTRCNSTSFVVSNLKSSCWYRFRIKASNIHGDSLPGIETDAICLQSGPVQRRVSAYSIVSDEGETEPIFPYRKVEIEDGLTFAQRYSVYEEMGKGRFGVVYRAMHCNLIQPRAAKFVRCLKGADREKVKKEIEIMNLLRSPKLLQIEAAFDLPKEIVIVTELITGGELFERVVADDFTLTERDCILFMRQICEGVQYMHSLSIVHLDLKPENILCVTRASHSIKLIDFGLAKQLNGSEPLRVMFGTPEFIPPEIVSYEPVTLASDMWALGVVCYVLISGLSPFMGDSDAETFSNITRGDYDFDDEAFFSISQEAKDFIASLLAMKPEQRLTATD